ncbi:hypothetical protein FXO38_25711 [Capsicum annuum]|uniref:Uncharacterized protein n=1 Tax=Capsicum annuum TaxID=4072 RepID=A0A2G2ZN94_CAPAN|nr:hypothetical protein FXO38_25711 [Capsicum annuum]KAF3640340.1 hypothetical protein FXO37_23544 [Capsicum annuum]PHT83415.1 hypothetical protein T459_11858 [Capsicum annuum]
MSIIEVLLQQPGISNHSPLRLELGGKCRGSAKSFRFFNCLVEHLEFIYKVIKYSLKKLNNSEFKNVREKVADLRGHLNRIQEKMNDHSIVEFHRQHEQDWIQQLEKWSLIEESVMVQKSRV